MPLSEATIKSTYITKATEVLGPAADATAQDKAAEIFAKWLLEVLTNQAAVTTNGATGTGPSGGPLPIVNQPGVIG